ncbi:MAG: hypothetical protein RMJ86_07570 [Anaerolineae bacterium]|nr:hypothetical protein [Thermoflexales bacterium]MCX7937806.1 hypothetical protein [Thermoflexales bacterium]MDW8054387.1 hypothetical protein [Anaerolineae bacterium]
MRLCKVFALLVAASVFLSACTSESPAEAASEWFNALIRGDGVTLHRRTCAAHWEAVRWGNAQLALMSWLGREALLPAVEGWLGFNLGVDARFGDVHFEVLEMEEDAAVVQVSGEFIWSMLGFSTPILFESKWYMVKEGEAWRWCGEIGETVWR